MNSIQQHNLTTFRFSIIVQTMQGSPNYHDLSTTPDSEYRSPDDYFVDTLIQHNTPTHSSWKDGLTREEIMHIEHEENNIEFLRTVEERMCVAREKEFAAQCERIQRAAEHRRAVLNPIINTLRRIQHMCSDSNMLIELFTKSIEEALTNESVVQTCAAEQVAITNFIDTYYVVPTKNNKQPKITKEQYACILKWFGM